MAFDLELVELTGRAREFLRLEVSENQQENVASMAESYADALFSPEDGYENSTTWIRGVTRGGVNGLELLFWSGQSLPVIW